MKVKDKRKKPLTLRNLLGRVKKTPEYLSRLKLAAQQGWLTDGVFATKLTDKEQDRLRESYKEEVAAKRAKVIELSQVLPGQIGYMVEEEISKGDTVTLGAYGKNVSVDAILYHTLKKRHQEAQVHLSQEEGPVIFSERNTVAILHPKV